MAYVKKFNGKIYRYDSWYSKKSDAERRIGQLKRANLLARKIYKNSEWIVYYRRKG